MFGLIRKKTLVKNLIELRDFTMRDLDKTGDVDSYDYYGGVVDTCNDLIFRYSGKAL